MKKSLGKRLISGVTSGLLAVTYALPSGLSPLRSFAAEDGVASDGLPILQNYEDTMWYTGNPLGIAGDFHLFSFTSVKTGNHINGNVATPVLEVEFGEGPSPNKPSGDVAKVLNVISKSIIWGDGASKGYNWMDGSQYDNFNMNNMTDIMLPVNYEVTGTPGWVGGTYYPDGAPVPYPTTLLGGGVNVYYGSKEDYDNAEEKHFMKLSSQKSTSAYVGHAGEKFIDFEALKKTYEDMSDDYSALSPRYFDLTWEGGDPWETETNSPATLVLESSGVNVLNFKASDADKYERVTVKNINTADGEFMDGQTLIVNIDLEEAETFKWAPGWKYYSKDDAELNKGGEETVYEGTNIIYNFYNAKEGGTFVDFGGGAQIPMGIVLAPDTDFEVAQINGNIIANSIHATNETHAVYFKNALTTTKEINISVAKSWSDGNSSHTNDSVEVTLYRAKKGGVKNILDEFRLDNRFEDAVDAVASSTGMNSYGMGERLERQTASADRDAMTISLAPAGGEPAVIMQKSGDEVTTTLEDGTYTFSRSVGAGSRELTFVAEGGKITAISGSGLSLQEIGTVTLNEEGGWSNTWNSLLKIDGNGKNYYYYAVEKNVPAGYTVSYDGNSAFGGNRTITVVNTSETAVDKLKFIKLTDTMTIGDETDERVSFKSAEQRLEGARFTLTLTDPSEEGAKLSEGVKSNLDSNTKGKPTYGENTITWTTINQDIEFEGLPYGGYTLKEEAPEGYQTIREEKFGFDKNGFNVVTNDDAHVKYDGTDLHNRVITITDDAYTISLRKVDENDKPVPGALLRLTSTSGADMTKVKAHDTQYFTADGIGRNTSDSAPSRLELSKNEIKNVASDSASAFEWYSIGSAVVFTGLQEGTYTLEEVSAPAGYSRSTEVRTFTIARDENGKLSASGDTYTDAEKAYDKINDIINKKQTISVSKNDMNATVIEGAEFRLTKKDGTALGKITVDVENAEETYSKAIGLTANSKQITIKNTSAGMGYTLRGNTFNNVKIDGVAVNETPKQNVYETSGTATGDTLEISGLYDGSYVLTLDDGRIYNIRVESGMMAPEVSVSKLAELTDGGKAYEFTGGEAAMTGLDDGDYVLEETASPNGYTKVESKFEFNITDGKITLTNASTTGNIKLAPGSDSGIIITDSVSEITLTKEFGASGNTKPEGPAGAEMKLTFVSASGKPANTISGADTLEVGGSVTWKTSENNPKTFKGLMDGTYKFEETKEPAGYEKAEAKTFVIKDGVIADMNEAGEVVSTRTTESLLNTKKGTVTLDKTALGGSVIPAEAGQAKFTLEAVGEGKTLKGVSINGGEALGEVAKIENVECTDNNITFTGLKKGTYKLTEATAPSGYSVVSTFTFEVDDKGKVVSVSDVGTTGKAYVGDDGHIKVEDAPIVVIDKAALGGEIIKGSNAKFTLTAKDEGATLKGVKVNNEELGEVTSYDFEGNSTKFEYLQNGTYSLKETAGPEGFSTVSEFTFTISNGLVTEVSAVTDGKVTPLEGGKVLKIEDQPIIKLDKVALGGAPIPESAGKAKFTLKAEDEGKTLEGVKLNGGAALGEGVTEAEFDGNNATFEYLKAGKYSLEETTAPNGYATVTKFTFEVDDNGKVTNVSKTTNGKSYIGPDGEIVVEDNQSTVTINKKALGGEELPAEAGAATFVLKAEETGLNLGGVTVSTGETAAAAPALGEDVTAYTFTGNNITFTGLKNGKYSLEETAAPNGYTVVTKFNFTIDNGKVKEVETATNGNSKKVNDTTIQVEDARSTVVLDKKALGGEPIPAGAGKATFTLSAEEGKNLEGVEIIAGAATSGKVLEATDTSYTFQGNNAKFTGLKKGTYTLEEIAAPDGFTTATKFTFDINEKGQVTNVVTETDGQAYIDKETGHLVVEDTKTKVIIDKKALGGEPIAEEAGKAKFTLTAADEGLNLNGVVIGEGEGAAAVENDSTSVEFDGNTAVFNGLKAGTYTLKETTAPDGFTTVTEFKFSIDKDGKVTVLDKLTDGDAYVDGSGHLVVEDAKSTMTLDKKALGGEEIPAEAGKATFVLTVEEDGKTLNGVTISMGEGEEATSVTFENGETSYEFTGNNVNFTGLKNGTYSLEETAAPGGFTTVTKFTFDIVDGKVDNVGTTTNGKAYIDEETGHLVVEDGQNSVTIDKKALGGEEIPAEAGSATFIFKAEDEGANFKGVTVSQGTGEEATSETIAAEDNIYSFTGNNISFTGLRPGVYSLEETAAPSGFVTVTKFTFSVDKDGKVTVIDTVTDGDVYVDKNGHLVVEDAKTTVVIDKKALGGAPIDEAAGKAKFTLTAKTEGLNFNGVTVGEGEGAVAVEDGKTSVDFDGNTAVLKGLKKGTYTLKETTAPDGFITVTEFTFDVDEKGYVSNVSTVTDGNAYVDENDHLVVEDDKSTITLDKKALGGEEIPAEAGSATFVLAIEEAGKTLEGVTVNMGEGEVATSETIGEGVKSYEFTGNNIRFTGLKDGKYSLEETAAPNGYSVVTKFNFTIDNGVVKDVDTVTTGKVEKKNDGKTIEVQDELESTVTIDKKALGAKEITADAGNAVFTLTSNDEGVTFKGVKINGGEALGEITETQFPGNSAKFTGLKSGHYTLVEKTAPDGYEVVSTFTFYLDGNEVKDVSATTNGKAYVDEETGHLVIEDAPNEFTIGKYDITGKKEVKKAQLELTNPDIDWTSILDANKDDKDFTSVVNSEGTVLGIQWISGDAAKIVRALKDGDYTLKETGDDFTDGEVTYSIITSELHFTISGNKITDASGEALETEAKPDSETGYYTVDKENGVIKVNDAEATTTTTTTSTTTTTTTTTTTSTTTTSTGP